MERRTFAARGKEKVADVKNALSVGWQQKIPALVPTKNDLQDDKKLSEEQKNSEEKSTPLILLLLHFHMR